MLHVTSARYLGGFRIRLRFSDGEEGTVDLFSRLHGEVFKPLRDPAFFARFRISPDSGTIAWENGTDLAPEYLESLLGRAGPAPSSGKSTTNWKFQGALASLAIWRKPGEMLVSFFSTSRATQGSPSRVTRKSASLPSLSRR
ncbi:MAG: DUF2442 domain-containing protein [Spirochaetota bacterium]